MAIGTWGSSLKHLRALFRGGTAVGVSDRDLLRRYAASHDGLAFEALVARHGPMVVATCRAVLRDPHDVEDAFQATFLVLARKAASVHAGDALGCWLHRVAYRAAVRLNVEAKRRRRHEAEVSAMQVSCAVPSALDPDVRSILHEEIDRLPDGERQPVVLCDLEGLTYEQAAARLHSTAPTIYHRLAKGRKRLRDRLIRRGVTGTAVGSAMELSRASTMAAVPTRWAEAVVAAATGGPLPTTVAALTDTLIRSLLMARLKIVSVTVLGMVALASVGVVAVGAARPGASSPAPPERAAQAPPSRTDEPKPSDKPVDIAAAPPKTNSLVVEARDLTTNAPVLGVRLELLVNARSVSHATTDASGAARFSLSADGQFLPLAVMAVGDGLVSQMIQWHHDSNSPVPPGHLLFQMEKATTVGGRVVDQDQKPIAGATVVVEVWKDYPKSQQWGQQRAFFNDNSAETDASGHWSLSGAPAKPDSIKLAAYHELCLPERPFYDMKDFKPLSALRDGSVTLRLKRGTRIEGTVLSPDGRPVAGAEVLYGKVFWSDGKFGNAIPPLKTDAQGKFALGVMPGTISTLTARAPGFGPTLQNIRVGPEPLSVKLRLQTAHLLRGRVVDLAGKPIPRASLKLSWNGPDASAASTGSDAILHQLIADADGRFAWRDAPETGIHAIAYAGGFVRKGNLLLASDVDQAIVLTRPTPIKGTVVDGETGQPLPRFTVLLGAVWNRGGSLIWQRGGGMMAGSTQTPGSFEHTLVEQLHQYALRVSADGYLLDDSPRFSPDGTPHSFTFRLTRAAPIRGAVLNPDRSPAGHSSVYLVPAEGEDTIEYLTLQNGDVPADERSGTIFAEVGTDGRFSLPPQKANFTLLALADGGSVVVPRRELRGEDILRLRPWAHVSGTVMLDGKPAANLGLSSYDPDPPRPNPNEPRIEHRTDIETDAEGRFDLTRVMPGRLVLGRWVPNGVAGRRWFVSLATVDVECGKTYNLQIGRSGRRIRGRLEVPKAATSMIRKAEIVSKTSREKRLVPIGVEVFEDGRFEAVDLRPGDYTLRIVLHEPPPADACGWGRLLGEFSHTFTVHDVAVNSFLDLGVLKPTHVGDEPLEVGAAAPDFTVKTLDGKDLKLANLRGKFVLLDFWATWCAPCVAEVPNLKAVHDRFSDDPRFVLVSLSLDERPGDAEFLVRRQGLRWLQGFAGPDSPVVSAYGATAIPATFLISPEGKILARDIRGEATKAAVAEALKP
jgi:RNA polymerase sigma factor (sigma-70 family)